ncbi:MAG TPA: hypothetical protein VJN32_03625 [Dehalococcoidia bacterium]|nr:hypothetical protein [Dehalococcoidia bacterium]
MKKSIIAIVLAIGLFLALGGGAALAADCFVPKKPLGAGAGVLITVTPEGETFTVASPSGKPVGGFITLDLTAVGGPVVDTFALPVTPGLEDPEGFGVGELPIQARNAGPGDDLCDGKGVDSIGACFFSGD